MSKSEPPQAMEQCQIFPRTRSYMMIVPSLSSHGIILCSSFCLSQTLLISRDSLGTSMPHAVRYRYPGCSTAFDRWMTAKVHLYQKTCMLEYVGNASPTCLSLMLTPNTPLRPGKLLKSLCHSEQVGVRALHHRTRIAESYFLQDNARQQRKQRMAKE